MPKISTDSTNKQKPSHWVQLYFVLSSLLGLILTAIGSTMLITTLLNNTILKVPRYPSMPPSLYFQTKEAEGLVNNSQLSEDEIEQVKRWLQDYKNWEENEKNFNHEDVETKRTLTNAIALIITGLPILAFHAPTLFKQA